MVYSGMAWPGLQLSIKAVNRDRAKIQRWIKTGEDKPGCYIRHKSAMAKYRAMLADLDTGLKVLRDAERAMSSKLLVQTNSRKLSVQRSAKRSEAG